MDTSDTDITGRDARVIWKTVTVVAVIVATVISGLVTAVAWAVRHDARLESVERWQAAKDRDASRELWRRDFDRNSHPISPGVTR